MSQLVITSWWSRALLMAVLVTAATLGSARPLDNPVCPALTTAVPELVIPAQPASATPHRLPRTPA